MNTYKNKKVFITGTTGIKGSWLVSMLLELGAIVKGYALKADYPYSHYNIFFDKPINNFEQELGFIENCTTLKKSIQDFQPDILFHLSAQPLVSISYEQPISTFKTNIIGTANVLEACRDIQSLSSIIIITTDKVYKNQESNIGYNENCVLGGDDPYSVSKVCCEHIVNAYKKSFLKNKLVATVRAGNVALGGDFAIDRIIPDLIKSVMYHKPVNIRHPEATRAFTQGLDVLYGYLLLGSKLLGNKTEFEGAWNFSTDEVNQITVEELAKMCKYYWQDINYEIYPQNKFHETTTLKLDSTKAKTLLDWKPKYNIEQTIEQTIIWYKEWFLNSNVITQNQIKEYFNHA